MYRDLTMKEISEQQIGQTLQVAGWVENIRDHGGVSLLICGICTVYYRWSSVSRSF